MNRFLLIAFLSVFMFISPAAMMAQGNNVATSEASLISSEKEELVVLTNPVKDGYLKIALNHSQNNELSLTIINSLGKQVYNAKRTMNSKEQSFDVSKLSAGIYFLRVSTNSSNFVKKLIIR
ncbi:putative secreted protein (Por secretion system target) [Nonlabens dokdonensis]|nr:T9SS type A sorting domain-containing protein [Nonlabens dokdonensis]PZX39009.1 putative secreted protein (Por secretion system target) [Nonlabens dokdonensis]